MSFHTLLRNSFLGFFLITISGSLSAQKSELIKGRWIYKDIAEKEKLDSTTLKEAITYFSNLEFEFSPEGKYIYFYTPVGTWAMSEDESKVLITSGGRTNEMAVRSVTAKELQINMGKADLIMVHPAPPPPLNPAECENYWDKELHKFGLKDNKGKILIAPKYDLMTFNPAEGLWVVELDKKWGFVNVYDKAVAPIKYDYAHPFIEGRALVKLGDKCGFIDKTGKEIIPLMYTYVKDFYNGIAEVGTPEGPIYIDRNGNKVK